MNTFDDLDLPDSLRSTLAEMGYEKPTEIQVRAIPFALSGKDVLASAQTGTGKTGAFAIPLVTRMLNNRDQTALILLPTRELAMQVASVIRTMAGKKSPLRTALLIGGDPFSKQFAQLRANPRVVVATPGRLLDHLERRSVDLSKCHYLVLDETDRMLDMGFAEPLDEIIGRTASDRQTMMFSATLPKNINQLSRKYLNSPERIEVGHNNKPSENIEKAQIKIDSSKKMSVLKDELNKREGTVLIFVNTKRCAQDLADRLCNNDFSADAMHGDLHQGKRQRVLRGFRDERFRILVATDVAARGLDIPHIKHVINYDMPQCPEDYIHRIGRTARAGESGFALDLISPRDMDNWNAIQGLLDPSFKVPRKNGLGGRRGGNGGGRKTFQGKRQFGERSQFGARRDSGRSDGRSDSRPSFGQRRDSSSEGRPSYGQRRDSSSEGRPSYGQRRDSSSEGRPSYGQRRDSSSEGRPSFGQRRDSSSEGRPSFGQRRDSSSEGRPSYGQRRDNSGEGRSNFRPQGRGRDDSGSSQFGERKSYGERKDFGERKSFGDRKPRFENNRGDSRDRDFGAKPRRFDEHKPQDKKFGDKPSGEKKFFNKSDRDRKPGFKKPASFREFDNSPKKGAFKKARPKKDND